MLDPEDSQLIGPSPNEILARNIEDIKKLSLKRRQELIQEEYDKIFRMLAKRFFKICALDINNFGKEQKTALGFMINKRIKKYLRIWLGANIGFCAIIGFLTTAFHPAFLTPAILLLINFPIAYASENSLKNELNFRNYWKTLHQTDNPKALLEKN